MALDYARNVYEAVDRRMPEAAALANWLGQNAAAFGLPDTAIPDDEAPRRSRRGGVPVPDWRMIGSALTSAAAILPDKACTHADHWIEAIAGTLTLDPLEARILALALHYKLDQRVERLFDAMSECRGLITRFHRDSGLIALFLRVPTAEIEMRLTGDAKLRASGLLRLDPHGELCVLERLVSLIRQDVLPSADYETPALPPSLTASSSPETAKSAAACRAHRRSRLLGTCAAQDLRSARKQADCRDD
jgi:hypothetical protein